MAETREDAYLAWRSCGQNVEMTIRELAKKGYTLTKPTIYDWMEKFDWKDRAARAEAEEHKGKDMQLSFEEKMISALVAQKEKYEEYFAGLGRGQHDNQASFAYTNIVKTIIELSRKIKPPEEKRDPAELKRISEEILESEYGIKRQ
jgi:transposase